ncbi:MAG: hypothetical protein ABI203_04830 [Mucilaginibacter sp.]
MRKILYLLLILTSSAYGQEVEIGTVFTIEFNNPKNNMDFTLVSKKPYQGIIDISKIDSVVLKRKPTENQIIGVFAKGKFGDRISSMLVLISGLNNNLDYGLEIKTPINGKIQHTSTSSLFKNVKSIEYWPYDIEKINFTEFKVLSTANLKTVQFQEKVDSTCIKNADKNIALGEQEFKSYFKSIVLKFEGDNNFKIDQLLKHEKSINSEDVSLGYFWSLGGGIYPNKKRYKFGNPFSFRRVECPYFAGSTDYFYTKVKGDIKVIAFNWETFKESNLGVTPEIKDVGQKFTEKYDFLVGAVSELLGKPLAIEQEENSGRVDTKWHSTNGINAYLFRFKDYNEIRLYIYKE